MKTTSHSRLSRAFMCAVIAFVTCSVTGCWDYHELERDAQVRTFTYDLTEQGEPLITMELQMSKTGSSQDEDSKNAMPASAIVQATGPTFYDAIENLTKSEPNILDFSHHESSIFNEDMMKSHYFQDVLDRITRYSTAPRRRVLLFATSEKASSIFQQKIPFAERVGEGLYGLSTQSREQQVSTEMDLNEFLYELSLPGIEPLVPRLKSRNSDGGENEIIAEGSAAFRNKRFAGWLSGKETRGVLWLRGEVGNPIFTVPWQGKKLTVKTQGIQKVIRVQIGTSRNSTPKFQVKLYWQGSLEMYSGSNELKASDTLSMQEEIRKYLEKTVEQSVRKSQQLQSDVLGLGNALYRKAPQLFKKRYKQNWDETGFPKAVVQIEVEPKITGFGYTTNPLQVRQ